MRDPNRIDQVMTALRNLWNTYPDLRFFQLVDLVSECTSKEDPFYLEDDKALEAIKVAFSRHTQTFYAKPEASPIIYFDGGARGNGKADCLAGYAFVTWDDYHEGGIERGATNNEMEYMGLHAALNYACACGLKNPEFKGDSKLVVEQVNGRWKCKAKNLQSIHNECTSILKENPGWTVTWIPREENPADAKYNDILDRCGYNG
jgi:ribonuclease HI